MLRSTIRQAVAQVAPMAMATEARANARAMAQATHPPTMARPPIVSHFRVSNVDLGAWCWQAYAWC